MKPFLIALALGVVLVPPGVAAELPFDGSWSMVSRMGDNEIPATMTLSLDAEVSGIWFSQGRETPLTAIEIDGNSIRFNREMRPGQVLHFSGTLEQGTIRGAWSGSFGEIPVEGRRAVGDTAEEVSNLHSRPIVEEDGKRMLWAGEHEDGTVEWFDMTDSTIDPHRFQYGIGKDTIPSIDAPQFVASDDPLLAARGVTAETPVLGVTLGGIARAYPVSVLDRHEVVNDRFGETSLAVFW